MLAAAGEVLSEPAVLILLPDQKAANREFSEALQKALRRVSPTLSLAEVVSVDDGQFEGQQKIVVAVGSQAYQAALTLPRRGPVVAALLPRLTYEKLQQQATGATAANSTAVFLDQSEERQLALLSLLPGPPTSVGVVRSASSGLSMPRLRAAAPRFRIKLVEEVVSSERDLASAIQVMASQSDVILATPDPEVFNPQTIQGILLSAYRARVPLVGFSPAYTRAGALISLHSSVNQLAQQTAEVVRLIAQGDGVPPPQSPNEFEVSINRQVARSMSIDLPAEAVLVDKIKARARLP